MNRWTVHVKNFGKIEDASVEVAPLTLFVGDNNSGKSYMMTLIYGLLTVNFFFDKYCYFFCINKCFASTGSYQP